MANLNPLVTGDVPYPQYSVTTTMEVIDGESFPKGRILTVDILGKLTNFGITLATGIFQAKVTNPNDPSVAGDAIQVLAPRTRMILRDRDGGLTVGLDVIAVTLTDEVIAGAKSSDLYIGKVFEIYTKDTQGTTKLVSGIGDLVIVETVGP